MKLRSSFYAFFSSLLGTAMVGAQTNLTLDGTSGNNSISTSYSTNGGLNLSLGFFADYLVVGGGGSGGTAGSFSGTGGGGAGGLLTGNLMLGASNFNVTVGAGGVAPNTSGTSSVQGVNGGNSVFGNITALGGGGGGRFNTSGNTGGSGGGAGGRASTAGGAGTADQGYGGGLARSGTPNERSAGGGGGGAGSAGGNANQSGATIGGNGGAGLSNSITGTAVVYAGGGGGGAIDNFASETAGTGGSGGGGAGGIGAGTNGTNGLGGGGGGAGNNARGGNGGSGVVIVRYQGSSLGNIGGTVTSGTGSAAGYTIHTFTNTGAANFDMSGVNLNSRLGATVSSAITGDGNLTFNGPGTLTLGAANSYRGATQILGGTLRLADNGTLGEGSVTNNSALLLDRSNQLSIAGDISGTGTLTQQGTGTTILSGNNNYSGSTTISAGTLQIGNGGTAGSIGSGAIAVTTSNARLAFNRSDDVVFNHSLTGSGRLEQAGSGTLTVLGENTNSGGTIVSAGTLRVGNGGTTGSLGNGNISMASGATLAYDRSDAVTLGNTLSGAGNLRHSGSGTLTITANNTHSGGTVIDSGRTLQVGAGSTTGSLGTSAVTNNGTLVYNRSGSSTFANNISGTGSLDITTTASSVTLSGNNSYTGITRVRGTEVTIGSNALAGSTLTTFSEDNVANLQLRGTRNVNVYNIGGLSGNRNISFDSNFALTSVGSNNQNTTFSGSINAGQLSKVGTGILELSGSSNNFTGEFRIHSGKVEITGGNTTVVNWGISVGSLNGDNASLEIKDGRYTGNISLGQNWGSAGTMSMNGGTVTGAISVGHGSGSTGSFVMSGGTHILTNGNGLNVGVRGDGTYTLTNGTVNGTLFGPNTSSAARVAFDRGSIGTMNVSGGDISVLNFSLGRGVDSIGTLNLTGGRIVSAFGSIGTGQNSNSTINISGGSFETTSSSDLWFGGSSHRSRNIVNLTGSGNLSSAGSISYYDTSPDSSLTFNIGTGGEAGTLTALKIDLNGSNSRLNFNHTNESYNLSSSIVGDPLVVSQIGSGKTILSGSNLAWRGGTVISGGTLQVGNGGSHSSTWAVSNITNNGTLVINSGISSTILGVMSGSGSLVKEGMGTLTLYGDNAFTGNTIINDGALQTTTWSSGGGPTQFGRLHSSSALTVNTNGSFILGGAQTLGGLSGNGTITLRSHHLTLNAAGDSEFSGGIFGTGGLTKEGSGTFTLSGANNFKGNTLVNDGRLVLSSSSALGGASVVKVNAGGTLEVKERLVIGFLDLNGGTVIGGDNLVSSLSLINDGTVSGLANGADFAAGILKRTTGLATVDGANTYTGTTKIEAGVVRLVAGGSFAASSSLFLQNGGTMDLNGISQTFSALDGTGGTVALGSGDVTVNGSGNSSFAGDITGQGKLIKSGSGSLTLSGSNSQTGGYEVTGGRLIGSTSSLNGNIANQGIVEFRQDSDATLGTTITGTGALVKSGSGTLTITTGKEYTGATTVSSGKLVISGSSNSSSLRVESNATLVINGSTSNASNLQVDAIGTLMGSGTIRGNTTISGIHSPGNSPGIQTFNSDLTYANGANIIWELIGNTTNGRGTNYDGINVVGNLNFTGPTTLTLDFGIVGSMVDWSDSFWSMDRLSQDGWKIFEVDGDITELNHLTIDSAFTDRNGATLTSIRSDATFFLSQQEGAIYLNYSAIPEPSTTLLGIAGAAVLLRRRRKN